MIVELELDNYRGFVKHKIPLRQTSVIVGRNNAGKSTIIEALTLVSIVALRAPRTRFVSPPDWLKTPSARNGISPSLRGLEFEFRNLCYRYGEPPAIITAKFSNKVIIKIYLNSETEDIFAVLRKGNSRILTASQASNALQDTINVLPPIGRLRLSEEIRNSDYVRSNINTRLSSLHFRNQIYYLGGNIDQSRIQINEDNEEEDGFIPTFYDSFVALAESSWPHLRIDSIDRTTHTPPQLNLLVRDGAFVAEVGWVGSGLQAWLQTCWFLARCARQSIVVLDEPDAYLHPDLQRRLFHLVEGYFAQVLVATHSTEILAEVNPDDVLVVDKDSSDSKFAENIPAVQSVIDNIGGAHNLQLTRLWSARKCVFIEGDDFDFLTALHEKIFPDSPTSFNAIPHISINGFGNWKHAVGAAIGLKNAGDQSIKAYCILDSDYRPEAENEKIKKEARGNGLNLHIWNRKEIENYVLSAPAISRVIEQRTKSTFPNIAAVEKKISEICEAMQTDVFDQISNEIGARDRQGSADANKKARKIVKGAEASSIGVMSICPGKDIVSTLSGWSKKEFGVSFSALAIAREMQLEEIAPEALQVITAMEQGADFAS